VGTRQIAQSEHLTAVGPVSDLDRVGDAGRQSPPGQRRRERGFDRVLLTGVESSVPRLDIPVVGSDGPGALVLGALVTYPGGVETACSVLLPEPMGRRPLLESQPGFLLEAHQVLPAAPPTGDEA